ncbi:hypothetical protein D3C72_2079330 [compost metagenome]
MLLQHRGRAIRHLQANRIFDEIAEAHCLRFERSHPRGRVHHFDDLVTVQPALAGVGRDNTISNPIHHFCGRAQILGRAAGDDPSVVDHQLRILRHDQLVAGHRYQ